MRDKEATKYGRLRNEALGMDVEAAQDMIANRERANKIRAEFARTEDQVDELQAAGMYDEADRLAGNYFKQKQLQLKIAKDFSEGLTAETYEEVKQGLQDEGMIDPAMWPNEYDPNWFKTQNTKNQAALSRLTRKWEEGGIIYSQDVVSRGGVVDEELTGTPYADPDDVATADQNRDNWTGWTATDSNTIGKQSERLHGGFYDIKTGMINGLSKTQAAEVAQVQKAAEQIYVRGRNAGDPLMTHARAIEEAAIAAGIPMADIEGDYLQDPLGLNDTEAGRRRQQQ